MNLKAAAIGSTGRGNFGHGLDTVFKNFDGVDYVAVADDNPQGLKNAAVRTGASQLFADYRAMVREIKPDLVSIGPRWTDQRLEMVQAAAGAGAHLYVEKPLAASVHVADEMLAACRDAGVKMAVAHQTRAMPPVQKAWADFKAGKFGRLVRMRGRGKEDRRGGGEDLIVLGTHVMDLMTLFGGAPRWISARIFENDRPVTLADARKPTEEVGVVAGNNLTASYGFDDGVLGFFDSRANLAKPGKSPFGVDIECEEAIIAIREGEVHIYPSPCVVPGSEMEWEKVWVEDWHFFPDHTPRPNTGRLSRGNVILVKDLIAAIAEDRKPLSSGEDALMALEMIQGVYASHFADAPVAFPLKERRHPLMPS